MQFLAEYTKEFKYNLKLAYPVILSLLGHTFVQLVDNIMVGQLGSKELAAVSLGNSFFLHRNGNRNWFFNCYNSFSCSV